MGLDGKTWQPGLDGRKLSHAYIVSGGLADALAMSAVCDDPGESGPCGACPHCAKASHGVHPDIMVVEKLPDKREILIEQIRELKKDVIVVPNEAEKKAYVVNDADLMNAKAQNAFLQILEEPPSHAVFILRTENPAALLPTVRSRCVELKARVPAETVTESGRPGTAGDMAGELFGALERGNAQLMAFMFRLEKLDKEAFSEFLASARDLAAARLRECSGGAGDDGASRNLLSRAERVLSKAGEMLDLNVATGHLSGMICASLMAVDS